MPTREDYAWAAGLFDGEGCLSGKRLVLVNTDKELVDRFERIFPGGTWKTIEPKGNHKLRYDYTLASFHLVQNAIACMWGWLSIRRRTAAEKLLLLRRNENPRGIGWCQKRLHRMEGDNVVLYPRSNRPNGNPVRRCKACLDNWYKERRNA